MRLLLVLVVVLCICLLLLVTDRAIKAVQRGRRRREANERLVAVAARAEAKEYRRRTAAEAREALTSVLPTIHEHDPRHVD